MPAMIAMEKPLPLEFVSLIEALNEPLNAS
jgi:hypothetical protein